MAFLDGHEITLPCPKCGRETKKTIGWIKTHKEFVCTCGVTIQLDTDQFTREIGKVDRAVGDLQRTIKKFGK